MNPIIPPKYSISARIEQCSEQLLEILEPWFDRIYSDCISIDNYIEREQSKTLFNLRKRCHELTTDDKYDYDDILVEINGDMFNQQDYEYIEKISQIIDDSGEIGTFNLGNLNITIKSLETYENNLIINEEKNYVKN